MTPSLIRKYDVKIIIWSVATAKKVEGLHCVFVFGWIRLKFGFRGVILGFWFQILTQNSNISTKSSEKYATFLLFDRDF